MRLANFSSPSCVRGVLVLTSRYGRKLRRRTRVIEGVDGFVVWLDPASPEPDTADRLASRRGIWGRVGAPSS
jgi:hypothetical protein